MKKMRLIFSFTAIITGLLFAVSCTDNNETPPPVKEFVPGEIVTVQQVRALYADQLAISDYTQRHPVEIVNNWALRGIITASDKEDGNFYKEAFIEDATGGLRLLFESTSGLYIGDSLIVNLKGLWLGDYGNFWQLGGVPYYQEDDTPRVGGMNMDMQCLKLSIGNPTYPAVVTITQAKSPGAAPRCISTFSGSSTSKGTSTCAPERIFCADFFSMEKLPSSRSKIAALPWLFVSFAIKNGPSSAGR